MAGQARDLQMRTGGESSVSIAARACLAPLRPTGAGPNPAGISVAKSETGQNISGVDSPQPGTQRSWPWHGYGLVCEYRIEDRGRLDMVMA